MRTRNFIWLFRLLSSSISLWFCVELVSGQCLDSQKSLLLELRENLNFDPSLSTVLVRWNKSMDCCYWGGVKCDTGGHVIGLNLNNESINGGIDDSSSLFGLHFLRTLNLAYNNFNSSQIPSGLGKLTQLRYLNLSNANFEGNIPSEISLLTRLVTLDLSSVSYLVLDNSDLKMLIQNLTELRELYLDHVNITSNGYHWHEAISSSLPNLRVLSLRGCSLSGPLDPSLSKLKYLSVILLDENTFSSPVPESFASLPNLTVLSLQSCDLFGSFPKRIFLVPTLKTIDLSNNRLLEGSLPEFPHSGSLENLILSYTLFSGKLPGSIGYLGMLSRIELRACNFSGPLPGSLANLTKLVYVDLSSNRFSGSLPSLHMSKNLTLLNLHQNSLTREIPQSLMLGLDNIEFLDLSNNSLSGSFPEYLLTLPSLQFLDLSTNQLSGQIDNMTFMNVSSYQLTNLDLSSNRFEGPIPRFIFKLRGLLSLLLSDNYFNGSVELSTFGYLKDLDVLELSRNNLSINVRSIDTSSDDASTVLPQLSTLHLASCNMQRLPDLRNQSRLMELDLSDNKLSGEIPNWLWEVGNGFLRFLNISHNQFSHLQEPYSFPFLLDVLDVHSNNLEGNIPIPSRRVYHLDYSSNNFATSIPVDIGNLLTSTFFFSIANSKLVGAIPQSICNASKLSILDLSNNSLHGTIPSCLLEGITKNLVVLNLRGNKLGGNISRVVFPQECELQTLDLSGNHLQGQIPGSIANCTSLEVLNLGDNMISDTFPCWLKNLSKLRVFVIRSNSFHGHINCIRGDHNFTNLQVIDLASNSFSGTLPVESFSIFEALVMNKYGGARQSHELGHLHFQSGASQLLYYQDSLTVVFKGLEMHLVKILTVFTSIDFSSNRFEGSIPDIVGDLVLLKSLNLSHNSLSGKIPPSMGNLKELESLDLSLNKINGTIPETLARLTFLSSLNLSYNQLSGRIPQGPQFQTFTEASFEGNVGLCGAPLNKSCDGTVTPEVLRRPQPTLLGDAYHVSDYCVSAMLGFFAGFIVIVGPLVFCRRWRTWYNNHLDQVFQSIVTISKNKDDRIK